MAATPVKRAADTMLNVLRIVKSLRSLQNDLTCQREHTEGKEQEESSKKSKIVCI